MPASTYAQASSKPECTGSPLMDAEEDYGWPLERGRMFASEFFTEEELTAKQQENTWLRRGGPDEEPDNSGFYFPTYDYSYTYYECISLAELKKAFQYGNWAIRQCFTYRNLAFINQINGRDEWWTLKKFPDGRLLAFESCSMAAIVEQGYFEDYISQLLKATYHQCRHLEYLDDEFKEKHLRRRPLRLPHAAGVIE